MKFWIFGIYNLFNGGLLQWLRSRFTIGVNGEAALIGIGFIFCILVSYLLGSINWALVISKLFYHDDVRRYGSGNAGTTNILRTYGKKAAIYTFVGDALKGSVSVLIACLLFGYPIIAEKVNGELMLYDPHYIQLISACYLSAFFCMLGHIFPCFAKFKGGKGFATFVGCVLVLNPGIFLILFVIFATLLLGTQYVSLGSIMTVMFYPILLYSFDSASTRYGVGTLLALAMAALVVWSHRSNIKRLLSHTENKTRIFKKKASDQDK